MQRSQYIKRKIRRINPFISTRYFYVFGGKFFDLKSFKLKRIEPNLVIPGSQKSGTTGLYRYLARHPDIFMSSPLKEPGYFCDFYFIKEYWKKQGIFVKTRNQLLRKLMLRRYKGQQIFCDASTYYTLGTQSQDQQIPQRMKSTNPDMKFIYILRNPFERLVSSYLHYQRQKKKCYNMDFNSFIGAYKFTMETSLYGQQISKYLKHFPLGNFLIIIFEEFLNEPKRHFDEICDFLSLNRFNEYPEISVIHKSTIRGRFSAEELLFAEDNYLHHMVPIKEDMKVLESIIGRPVNHWDLSKERWCLKCQNP